MNNLHEDIIASCVVNQLKPHVLVRFLRTCKIFYERRKIYIDQNDYIEGYKYFDNDASYFHTLVHSHIGLYNSIPVFDKIDCDLNKIRNTTKIITYQCYNDNILRMYYRALLKIHYGYKFSVLCELKLDKLFHAALWTSTNIHMYDIYCITYHIFKHNFRALQKTIIEFTFMYSLQPDDTIKFIMSYMDDENDVRLRAVMIGILYTYLKDVIESLMTNEKNTNYINMLILKSHEFRADITNISKLPKYIKKMICDSIQDAVISMEIKIGYII